MFSNVDTNKVEPFEITVFSKGKNFKMRVTQQYVSAQIERFLIEGGQRQIELQSNRPMLRAANAKKGINWKVIKGEDLVVSSAEAFTEILRALEKYLKDVEKRTL